jgi:glyoxylase-like metal-dependent hydrolase (beta-lactamase superfamily II)
MKSWVTKSGNKIIRVLAGRSNVFLLTNGEKNILIDTSTSYLWGKLQRRLGLLNIETIDYLVLTHSHFDHAANAKRIKTKYKPTIVIHKNEALSLSRGEMAIPNGTLIFTTLLVRTLGRLIPKSLLEYTPCEPDLLIDSDYSFKTIGFNACLTHTPGHTKGSLSLIIDDEIAIVGDTLFGVFRWSVNPPYADDRNTMINSWKKLLDTKCLIFLPSHGSAIKRSLLKHNFRKIQKIDLGQKSE